MKKRIFGLLALTSIALVASVISINSSFRAQPKELTAEDLPADQLYFAPADSTVNPPHTYLTSPTNEDWYKNSKQYTKNSHTYERNMKTTVYDRMNVSNTWQSYRGEGVKVAVIDTGCYTNHEDFGGTNISSLSKNMVSGSTGSNAVNDTHGHGTTSAAMVAAAINGVGASGIAPNVELVILKCVDDSNAFNNTAIINALQYCIDNKIDVVNMSIQGYTQSFTGSWTEDYGEYSTSADSTGSMTYSVLQTKITQCYNAGITIVASAGNYNSDNKSYPAANDHVIAVGSTGLTEENKYKKAGYSNHGDWVDICAPGYVYRPKQTGNTDYDVWNGTSFSSPLVAGAIALYKSKYPNATPDQIEKALKATAHSMVSSGCGAGAIDVDAFLAKEPDHVYVESVELDEDEATLGIGETLQLNTTVLPTNATNKNVIYQSEDESICTVDDSGLVTAIGQGSTEVYVYSEDDDNQFDGIAITVEQAKPTGEFVLVTSESDIKAGDSILFVYETSNNVNGTLNSTYLEAISAEIDTDNHKLTTLPEGAVPIIVGGSSGAWTFTLGGTTLLYGHESGFSTSPDSSHYSTATLGFSSNNAVVKFNGSYELKYNTGAPRFRPYGSGVTGAIQIYKQVGGTPTQGYTVSFNANGGSGTMSNSYTSGSSYTVPLCSFSRTNYSFDKWALNSPSGTTYSVGETITDISSNITLYAIWKEGTGPTPGPVDEYYQSITATSGGDLLAQLHTLMGETHKKYTTYDNCKDANIVYSTDPGSSSDYITDFYTQYDIGRPWKSAATGTWNREHVWCQSLTNDLWGTTYGGSDLHHIRPIEATLNSTRNNHPFGVVPTHNSSTARYPKDTSGKYTSHQGGWFQSGLDIFEPIDDAKGDVARILMYTYMHYSNATHGTDGTVSGHTGDLYIDDIVRASTSNNTAEACWDLLLDWNANDPVSTSERVRNEAAFAIQKNRNPFIDHPEYAAAIWGDTPITTKTLDHITLGGNYPTTFNVGEAFSSSGLVVTAYYSDESHDTVTPKSISSPDMSTAGQKPVTVTYTEGGVIKQAEYTITVSNVVATSISLNKSSATVKIGSTDALSVANWVPSNVTDKSITWTSSDESVATVDNGVVTAHKQGTATITAKTTNNIEATCTITVPAPQVDNVSLDVPSKTIRYVSGGSSNTFSLTATLEAEQGATVTWTSSDESVVIVVNGGATAAAGSSSEVVGNFEVVGTGTATITATSGEKSAECEVRATLPVKGYRAESTTTSVAYNGSTTVVKADIYEIYNNTEEKVAENYDLSVDSSKLGSQTASGSYDGTTVSVPVFVTNEGSKDNIKTEADAKAQAEAWAIYFIARTRTPETCMAAKDEDKLTGLKAVWDELSAEYGDMAASSKTAFCSSSASDKIKEAMQHYQYIISKFNKDGSELDEFVVDGNNAKPAIASNRLTLSNIFGTNNSVLLISIFSIIGIAAILAFVIIKKRRMN